MACKRNRILELTNYLSSLGICINVGKNKARGHKGVFMQRFDDYRIDISKNLSDSEILSVLLHEFAHYVHYSYDKKLNSLEFAFGELTDEIKEELIQVTVSGIPKDFAKTLYGKKNELQNQLKILISEIKQFQPNFKIADKNNSIENSLTFPLKYLTKYDRIKYDGKIYSVDKLNEDFSVNKQTELYMKIKSVQRGVKRINSKINRLNRYYNNPSELFARFIDAYYTKPELIKRIAPESYKKITQKNLNLFKPIAKIFE